MVRLDYLIGLGAALDDIGVDSALREEVYSVEFTRLFLEYSYELRSDNLTLTLGIGYICELIEESVYAVGIYKRSAELFSEYFDNLLGLALAQQSVIDVHAYKLLADCADEQRRYHRAIYAAREREQYFLIAYLLAKQLNLVVDKVVHIPVSVALACVEDERLKSVVRAAVFYGNIGYSA